MSAPACIVCGASSWRPTLGLRRYGYVGCTVCGLARLDPLPPEAASDREADAADLPGATGAAPDGADEATERANATRRLALLRKAGAIGGQVVHVGGGSDAFLRDAFLRDAFLREARAWGWRLADAADGAGSVDAVVVTSIERMRRPDRAVADADALLRPGGLLMLEGWNRLSLAARLLGEHWPPVLPPPALYLFSRTTLPRLLVNAGLDRATVARTGPRVSVRRVVRALIGEHPALRAPLTRLVLRTGLADLTFTYGVGDVISVVARKPLARA